MIIPRHNIAPFYMYFRRRDDILRRRNLTNNILNGLIFFLSFRENVGFDKLVFNHKTNITSENLVAILY